MIKVSKISFKKHEEIYWCVTLSCNKNIIYSADIGDFEIDGHSFINTRKIKNIKNSGRRNKLYEKILEIKNTKIQYDNVLSECATLKEVISLVRGVVGVHLSEGRGDAWLLVGYVEEVEDEKFGLRFISPTGEIDKTELDWINYSDIMRLQVGGRYLKSFELFHQHEGIQK